MHSPHTTTFPHCQMGRSSGTPGTPSAGAWEVGAGRHTEHPTGSLLLLLPPGWPLMKSNGPARN